MGYSGGALGATVAAEAGCDESTAPEWDAAAPAVVAGGGCGIGRLACPLGRDCLSKIETIMDEAWSWGLISPPKKARGQFSGGGMR